MYAVVFALVLAMAIYLAGRPFFQPDPEEEALLLLGPRAAADRERDRVLAALTEIENDYQTGKLSNADYEELKHEYARKALEFLKADTGPAPSAAPLSSALVGGGRGTAPGRSGSSRRKAAGRDLEAEAEAEIALALAAPAGTALAGMPHCPHCGVELLGAAQKFCHACGGALGRVE